MKKKLLLTIVLISTILGAQSQKATLYFRDGTELKGLAKLIRGGTEVKYRKDKKSKIIVYNSQKIDKITLNSFKLFGLKRKLGVFYPIEGFFELHSRAMEGKKDKNRVQKDNFLAN